MNRRQLLARVAATVVVLPILPLLPAPTKYNGELVEMSLGDYWIKADPIDAMWSLGWKMDYAASVLDATRFIRIEQTPIA